jgi:hypothetical protein
VVALAWAATLVALAWAALVAPVWALLAPAIEAPSGQAELALLVVAAFIAAASDQADTHTVTETEVMGTDTVDIGTDTVAIGPT